MIVVLASTLDQAARNAVEEWSESPVTLLTPSDICQPGWRIACRRLLDSELHLAEAAACHQIPSVGFNSTRMSFVVHTNSPSASSVPSASTSFSFRAITRLISTWYRRR